MVLNGEKSYLTSAGQMFLSGETELCILWFSIDGNRLKQAEMAENEIPCLPTLCNSATVRFR